MSGVLQPAVNELTDDFNKLNPGIVVQAHYQGNYGVLNQKLIASVAAGNPPTISQVYANWTSVLIKANAIIPMERFIKGPDGLSPENINDILAPLRQANTFEGVMWTMPFNKSLYLLFYNADLFKEHNLKPPQTWDDLVNVAKALTKEEGGRIPTALLYCWNRPSRNEVLMASAREGEARGVPVLVVVGERLRPPSELAT